jgi:trimethylamine--corrinoid protein Co-methyltransferase
MGAVETMMIDSAYTQIGKHLNLPTHAYMGLSDSKINDSQSGFETGIGAVLAALSGVNVVSGPGMMNFESCQSLEKLVVDNEVCGMAYRLIEGISQRDEPIAKNLFEGFTAGSQFLSMPHTRKWYRAEHTFPRIIDRETYDAWASLGKKSIADRAWDEAERLLKENPASLLEKEVVGELKKIMIMDARSCAISSLPEIRY